MSDSVMRPSPGDRAPLLILSYSHIAEDARVLRQIELFSKDYDVTTVGFGSSVPGVIRHHELTVAGRFRKLKGYVESALLRLKLFRVMYWSDPLVRATRRALRKEVVGRVIANDIYTVPLALRRAGGPNVHADLHEYYPGLHDDNPLWRRLRQPYFTWLIEKYVPAAASVTTVGDEIAEVYRRHGIEPRVVANAPEHQPMTVGAVASPIRLVHAGAALPDRRIERMMRAVAESSADVELTLFLTPNQPAYVDELRQLAERLGPKVKMFPPVAHDELLAVLNSFDVGIHVLPATVTNQALALPNKFFDFVQSRLGIVVGPTPGMARLIEEHRLGAITAGFEEADIRETIDAMTPEAVRSWKEASDEASFTLSSASQLPVWFEAISNLRGERP